MTTSQFMLGKGHTAAYIAVSSNQTGNTFCVLDKRDFLQAGCSVCLFNHCSKIELDAVTELVSIVQEGKHDRTVVVASFLSFRCPVQQKEAFLTN